jgi:hydroxyacylglutathione hydrolase
VLYALPEDTVVYPAHGAGSLCGRRIGGAATTTIGAEKRDNWANQFETRESFVEAMVANLPHRPFFFYHCPFVNLAGATPLADLPAPPELRAADLAPGLTVLDTRSAEAFGAGHLADSLNVGAAGPLFSTWVGSLIRPEQPFALVVEDADQAAAARLHLARIGYEREAGFIVADADGWRAAGLDVREISQLDACDLPEWQRAGRAVLDVRTAGEWERGHLPDAAWIPLSQLPERLGEAPAGPLAVLCGSGYRSAIAASVLERAGRRDVVNVRGGWAAWSNCGCSEPDALDLCAR